MKLASVIKPVVLSRPGLAFVGIHWVLFAIGVYIRGDMNGLFSHAYYEPVVVQILMVLDLPSIALTDLFFPLSAGHSTPWTWYLFYPLFATLEWLVVGYIAQRIFFRRHQQRLP